MTNPEGPATKIHAFYLNGIILPTRACPDKSASSFRATINFVNLNCSLCFFCIFSFAKVNGHKAKCFVDMRYIIIYNIYIYTFSPFKKIIGIHINKLSHHIHTFLPNYPRWGSSMWFNQLHVHCAKASCHSAIGEETFRIQEISEGGI